MISFDTQLEFATWLSELTEIDCAWYQSPEGLDDHIVINAVNDNQIAGDDKIHFSSSQLELRFNTKSIQNKLKYNGLLREFLNANYITDYIDENEWYYTIYDCSVIIREI